MLQLTVRNRESDKLSSERKTGALRDKKRKMRRSEWGDMRDREEGRARTGLRLDVTGVCDVLKDAP